MTTKRAATAPRPTPAAILALALAAVLAAACASRRYYPPPPPDVGETAPAPALPAHEPAPASFPPPALPTPADDALAVQPVHEAIVVYAWAEPRHLPEGGGVAQILVRVHGNQGRLVPGVEVRLVTSEGSLFSNGRVLITDARGMTRDRLTASRSATITLNVGGTRRTLDVPVGQGS